jgi:glycosyltransferase involved in cell wall biosynthesis
MLGLYEALQGQLELRIITSDLPGIKPGNFPRAKVYPVAKSWGLKDLAPIRAILLQEKPDLFHQQYPSFMGGPTNRSALANLLPIWLKKKFPSIPLVTTFHEFGERRFRWRARAFPNLLASDALITITERDRQILSRWKKNVYRISVMSALPFRPRRSMGDGSKHRISYFGLLEPLKGFERFIEVAEILGCDEFEFEIIGGFHPDRNAYHLGLLDRVERKGLKNAFRFLGHLSREEAAASLAESDCCLMPFEEGVSERRSSFVAAVALQRPVVTTRGPYTPEIFQNVPGLAILSKDDLKGMAAKVRELVRTPRVDYRVLDKLIDPVEVGKQHIRVYEDLIAK